MEPSMLQPLRLGKPLILYLAIEKEAVGVMLVHKDENGVEHTVYYLSKKFLPYQANYNLVEKTCLLVMWATKKLQYYFQSNKIQAVSKPDPLKYL